MCLAGSVQNFGKEILEPNSQNYGPNHNFQFQLSDIRIIC
jgi:hypothetical protein